MAKIIAVNAGSSSLKFKLFEMENEEVITSGIVERIGLEDSIFTIKYKDDKDSKTLPIPTHKEAVNLLLDALIEKGIIASLDDIKGVGHRVVQGGSYFSDSAVVNDDVIGKISELAPLAPLHNPAHLIGIKAFQEAVPNAGAVTVFDTAFHQTIPEERFIYPIPYEYYEKYKIRKYGAHGTSHFYVSHRAIELLGNPETSKIVVCHLGAGGSLCAVENGKSVNTSMGLTPLAGIVMGTRCGDVDASVIDFMIQNIGMSMKEVNNVLNKQSGLLGVSGVSSDMRDVQAAAAEGNKRAQLALKIFVRRVADYLGRYFVELDGHIDAIAFTAGIGENEAYSRREILASVSNALGIVIDHEANDHGRGERLISAPESKVKVYVIPTDEELVIARDTKRLLNL